MLRNTAVCASVTAVSACVTLRLRPEVRATARARCNVEVRATARARSRVMGMGMVSALHLRPEVTH